MLDASQARLKVCWLRMLFKAHQRMDMQGNKEQGDALKIWQECDSPTEKDKERGETNAGRGADGVIEKAEETIQNRTMEWSRKKWRAREA